MQSFQQQKIQIVKWFTAQKLIKSYLTNRAKQSKEIKLMWEAYRQA